MANEQITVDLIPGKLPPTCHASQYDIGRTIKVNLTEGSAPYTLDGTETITVEVRKPDGNFVTASCTATLGNTYVDVVTTEQMTACAGMNLCNLKIEKGGNTIGTLNFIMAVEEDPIAGGTASDSVIHNIQALVDDAIDNNQSIADMESEIEDAREGVDGTVYDDLGEAIRTQISNVEAEIAPFYENYFEEQTITIGTDGYYGTNGTFYETTGRQYAIITGVNPSDSYEIDTSTQSSLIAGVIYFNSNDQVISYELLGTGSYQRFEGYALTIPSNCTKMIIQNTTTSTTLKLYKEKKRPVPDSVFFKKDVTVQLGEELTVGCVETVSGYTGTVSTGYTHDAVTSGSIQLYNAAIGEGVYILEFDTDYTAGEFVRCGFENDYRNYAYNGGTHIVMPLVNSDGSHTLFISNTGSLTAQYTLTNISLRKIDKTGENSLTITTNSVLNIENPNNYGFWNVILGKNTATRAAGSTRMIAIGANALGALKGGHRNIAVGTFAMSQMTGGEGNIAMGSDAMLEVKGSNHNVAIGREACYKGTMLEDNVAIGHSAMFGTTDSSAYYNVAIGANAGSKLKSHRSTFVGYQAGYDVGGAANTNYGNTMIGFNTKGKSDGYDNTCIGKQADFASGKHNSTAIGANAVATKSNQIVLGDANVSELVFGTKKLVFNLDGTVTWEAVT